MSEVGPAMKPPKPRFGLFRDSLSTRYVGFIVLFVVVTGLLLGAVATLASVRTAANERLASIEYASGVAAGALLPVIADQDRARILAQLESIMSANKGVEMQCIEILDVQGNVIAETQGGCISDTVGSSSGLLDVFTKPQVARVPVAVEGIDVAVVMICFRPVGLADAIIQPATATATVLMFAMVVAALWGGWLVVRTVVEPIGDLRDAAERISRGERNVSLDDGRTDEIGELSRSLDAMTTQLQHQESQLLESYGSLEQAYAQQEGLAKRLEQTMGMKSDFVAVASHEIRSPLAVIQLYAEMLEDNEFGETDPRLVDAVEAIVSAVTRLSSIVASLLDVAMLERGHMSLEYSDVALHEVVGSAVEDARALAASGGVSVQIEGELPEVVLRGDAVRLRQVLDNLLSNAIKYSGRGCVVSVGMRVSDDDVDIRVLDTGRGVPEDRAHVLFDLFGRGDTSDNADVAGLGLGLPIADRIARAHGGAILFAPNPDGKGTLFVVTLPLLHVDGPGSISVV
ncbi:MAG: HAMP domain-containing sensor histidine kinase [Coriobacteriia bacterium]|nr:HAMP domain-containing sensor histidine kinase [Coriobacteriia bacterium]